MSKILILHIGTSTEVENLEWLKFDKNKMITYTSYSPWYSSCYLLYLTVLLPSSRILLISLDFLSSNFGSCSCSLTELSFVNPKLPSGIQTWLHTDVWFKTTVRRIIRITATCWLIEPTSIKMLRTLRRKGCWLWFTNSRLVGHQKIEINLRWIDGLSRKYATKVLPFVEAWMGIP